MADLMEEVMEELRAVAFARPADCLRWEDGKLELKKRLPRKSAAGVACIERSSAGVKVKFHDKLKALQLLLEYGGTGGGGADNNLLAALLEATRRPFAPGEIDDIGELNDDNGIFIAEGD